MARWRFTNVTKTAVFWPILTAIDFKDTHPLDVATFGCTLVDVDSDLDFDLDDELIVEYAEDGSTYEVVFGGILSERTLTDMGRSDPRVWRINARDYSVLLDDTVLEGTRSSEQAGTRIAWIMAETPTQGITATGLPSLTTSLDAHDEYRGMSKREALDEIAQELDATWYVDFDRNLHFYIGSETNPAPFDLEHPAVPPTSYPYWDFECEDDASEMATRVLVDGATAQVWRINSAAETALGRQIQRTISDDSLDSTAKMNRAGDTFLANAYPAPRSGRLTLLQPGLRSGMTVHIVHPDWEAEGIDDDFVITSISVDYLEPNAADSDPEESEGGRVFWNVEFADRLRRIGGRTAPDVVNRITRRRTPTPTGGGEETGTTDGSPISITDKEASRDRVDFDAADTHDIFAYASPGSGPRPGSYSQYWVTQANPNWPCSGLGIFYWTGLIEAEVWYEVDLSGGISADWIGLRFASTTGANPVDTGLSPDGKTCIDFPWYVGWGYPDPTALGEWILLGSINPFEPWEIFVPRNLLTAAENALVIAPAWHAAGSFCGTELVSNSVGPLVGGEGQSRRYMASSDVSVTAVPVTITGAGRTQWVPGDGDIDGTNAEFSIPDWDGTGVPEARVDGLIMAAADYTYDSGAKTVTLALPPPAGAAVAFRYIHS